MSLRPTLLIAAMAVALLPSCESLGGGGIPTRPGKPVPDYTPRKTIKLDPKKAEWNSMKDVAEAFKGQPVKITGNKLDLNNTELSGNLFKQPKDRNDENAPGIHIRIDDFYLCNGYVRDFPGGIVVKGKGTTFYDLLFRGTSEDYLSNQVDNTPGMRVIKSRFYNSMGDKSLQLNDAEDAIVDECYFTGSTTGVRLQKKSGKDKNQKATVTGNTFEDVDTAWNISGTVKVKASKNTYKNVKTKWVANSGSYSEN